MTEVNSGDEQVLSKKAPVSAKKDKSKEYIERLQRTLIACFAGLIAGCLSFFSAALSVQASEPEQQLWLSVFILLAAIVVQKHIFMAIRIDTSKLGNKDWFYQGFMTFAFWFVSWTILLTGSASM